MPGAAENGMELEYITEEESPWRPELCRIWEQSVDLAAQPDPFCCAPVWQLSAHRAFAPGRRVLAQHTEDSVLVLAEAFLSSGQPLLTSLEAHWLFGCPLLGPDAIGLLAEALAVMSHGYGHLPALLLGGIVPGSRRARELYACCESLFTIYLAGECIQAGASLEGGLDGFLSRRSANLRSKWRKSFRRAADRGVTFERSCPTDTAGADAVYARMRADVLPGRTGNVFQAGIYDPDRKGRKDVLGFYRSLDQVANPRDYVWYRLGEWRPENASEYLWIGNGQLDKNGQPTTDSVFVDAIRFNEVE